MDRREKWKPQKPLGPRSLPYVLAAATLTALVSFLPAGGLPSGQDAPSMLMPPPEARSPQFGRSFRKTVLPDVFLISYVWFDARGNIRNIETSISKTALDESEKDFGFTPEELRAFLIRSEIEIREEKGLSARDLARKAVAEHSDPAWCEVDADRGDDFRIVLNTNMAGRSGGEAEIGRIVENFRGRWSASQKKIAACLDDKLKAFAKGRLMSVRPNGILADYRELIEANLDRMKPFAEEFGKIGGSSKRKLLELLLSFVQSIPSREIEPAENGRYTAGMRVPLSVLADDRGDCDAKAVLFASLWLNLTSHRTVLIRIRDHMLVGVAVPFVRGSSVDFQGKRYVLLEVCSGITLLPGQITGYSAECLAGRGFKYHFVN